MTGQGSGPGRCGEAAGHGRVFLVHLPDGTTDPYEAVLTELGHRVVTWRAARAALSHLREHAPDVLVASAAHKNEILETLAAHGPAGALGPDVVLLQPVKDDLEARFNLSSGPFWSMPLEFLHSATAADERRTPFSFRVLVHPADPQEFAQAVANLLEGRMLRVRHLARQNARQLYSACSELQRVDSAGVLYRQAVAAAMEVVGAVAGAVADWPVLREMEVRCAVGLGTQTVARLLGGGSKWERPRGSEWLWFKVPELLSRTAQRVISGNVLVVPLAERHAGHLMLILLTGQRSSLTQDMTGDLELVVEHVKLGLRQLGETARSAENRWRDPWTGLFNREGVLRAVTRVLESGQLPVSLLVVDIDRFSEFNERFGHLAGGVLLRACARRLLDRVPEARWVGRIGPDEFAMVLPGRSEESATGIARAIVDAVRGEPIEVDAAGTAVSVTVSVGVDTAASTRWSAQRLLERAFDALGQQKKRTGGGPEGR